MQRYNLPSNLVTSFLTVLRVQSHTKAAQVLNLSQPAVSQHISKLEELLGVKLVERSRGAIVPTKEARMLLPDLERLELTVEMMFDKARTAAQKDQQTVRMGTPTSMVSFLLAPVIANIQAAGRNVFPVIREVDDFHVYDMVRSGEVDFALTSMSGNDAELKHTQIISDRACVVFPAGHALDQKGDAALEEVQEFKLIRPPAGTVSERFLETCRKSHGCAFRFSAETSRLMTMEVMARAGIGILIVPGLSAQMISDQNLKFRPLAVSSVFRSCRLIRLKGNRLSPIAQSIVNGLMDRTAHLTRKFPKLVSP